MLQPALRRPFNASFAEWFEKNFRYVLLFVIGIQVLKGTALYINPYARSQYLWSYDHEFIKRGLVGTIAFFLEDHDAYRMLGLIQLFSYLSYFVFLYVLYRFVLRFADNPVKKVMGLLLVASPLLIAMGALIGYYDVLLLTILLIAYQLGSRPRIPAVGYVLLVILAVMIHELAIIFVVPPLLYQLYMHPETGVRRKAILIRTLLLVCVIYMAATFRVDANFFSMLTKRINSYAGVLSTKSGENFYRFYGNYALKNNFLHDFKLSRIRMIAPFGLVYGFFGLLCNSLVMVRLFAARRFWQALLYISMCYAPLLVVLVAWDVDRFICLSCCMSFLNFLTAAGSFSFITDQPAASGKWLSVLSIGLALLALASYYPISENYAEGETPISKKRQSGLLQIPSRIINRSYPFRPDYNNPGR
ncbi:MAG: hypothetical protein JST39_09575 [Bacteroidetes bacterium]|nr:hypothetical protein [Bacteroidota bacterium]